jgi:hypothetical protein
MTKVQDITLSEKVIQVKGNITSNMGTDKVMLSIHNGNYYNLGEIGGEIWELVKEPIEVGAIIKSLMTSYQVEEKLCEEHVVSFLTQLSLEGLIETVKQNI